MRVRQLLGTMARPLAPASAGLILAVILAGCAHGGSGSPAAQVSSSAAPAASDFEGALLPAGTKRHAFALTDQNGHGVSLGEFRGRVVILAFLYSTSRTVAPLIGQQIRGALDELALEHRRAAVPALAVSVDPTADSRI